MLYTVVNQVINTYDIVVSLHFMLIRSAFVLLISFSCISFADAQEVETLTRYSQIKLAQDLYEEGLNYFQNEEYSMAVESLSNSVSLDPNNYLAYFYLGSSFEQIMHYDKALLNYNLSLSLNQDFSEGLFNRAILCYKMEKYNKAIDDLTLLLSMPAGETRAIYFRGINYGEKDKDTGFDELITMSKKEADIYNYLGYCHDKLNNNNQAINYFTKAIELNEREDNYYVNRGRVYEETDKKELAKKDYQQALTINPENSLASINLMVLEEEEGMMPSIERLNEMIRKNPGLSFAYANRAYYHFKNNEFDDAISDYNKAIELNPGDHSYYIDRGMTFEKVHDLEAALRDYQSALQLEAGDYRGWYQLGNIFFKKEDFNSSIEYYSKAIQLNPDHANSYYNRGLAYFNKEQIGPACRDMNKAEQLNLEPAKSFLKKHCTDQ